MKSDIKMVRRDIETNWGEVETVIFQSRHICPPHRPPPLVISFEQPPQAKRCTHTDTSRIPFISSNQINRKHTLKASLIEPVWFDNRKKTRHEKGRRHRKKEKKLFPLQKISGSEQSRETTPEIGVFELSEGLL